jgi:hypothetical protein
MKVNKKHLKELKRRRKKKNERKDFDKSIRGEWITDPTKLKMYRVLVNRLFGQ